MTHNYIPVHSFATNFKLVYLPQKKEGGGRKIRKSYPSLIIHAVVLIYYSKQFSKPKKKIIKQNKRIEKMFTASSTDACTDFLYYQYESFGIPYTNNIWLIILSLPSTHHRFFFEEVEGKDGFNFGRVRFLFLAIEAYSMVVKSRLWSRARCLLFDPEESRNLLKGIRLRELLQVIRKFSIKNTQRRYSLAT